MSGRSEHGALWGFAGAIIAALIGAYATLQASKKPDPEPPHFVPPAPAPAPAPPADDPSPPVTAAEPSVTIQRVWLEHNVVSQGLVGMNIHVAFTANRLLGTPLAVSSGFSDANGNVLRDFDGAYRFPDGTAGVGGTAVPAYESAVFGDYVLFMPYHELHMNPGAYSLQAKVGITQTGSTGFLAVSYPVPFDFTN